MFIISKQQNLIFLKEQLQEQGLYLFLCSFWKNGLQTRIYPYKSITPHPLIPFRFFASSQHREFFSPFRNEVYLYSPSLSEALAEWILSERSGTFSSVARSSRWTTIFNLPFDLSISVFASAKDIFSVTVPFIWNRLRKEQIETYWKITVTLK